MKKERRSKHGRIAQTLRERITGGEFGPGALLPSRVQLAAELGVSMITVQRAIDAVAEDGFIVARGRAGTFVSQQPPHLCQYGLVFYSHPGEQYIFGGYSQTLLRQAEEMNRAGGPRIRTYFDIRGQSDSEDYQRLQRDLKGGRLRGVIFASTIFELADEPVMRDPALPRVVVGRPSPGISGTFVALNTEERFLPAIEHLISRGKRRIATLLMSHRGGSSLESDRLLRAMAQANVPDVPRWRQFVNVFDPESVSHAVQLLLHPDQKQRPDALIIADDTMFDAVVAGMMAVGVRVPDEVEVVAYANFPCAARAALPIRRIGFDVREVLRTAIACIDARRDGRDHPHLTVIDAKWEDQIDQPVVAAAGAAPASVEAVEA